MDTSVTWLSEPEIVTSPSGCQLRARDEMFMESLTHYHGQEIRRCQFQTKLVVTHYEIRVSELFVKVYARLYKCKRRTAADGYKVPVCIPWTYILKDKDKEVAAEEEKNNITEGVLAAP
jgi:hypothetical protein